MGRGALDAGKKRTGMGCGDGPAKKGKGDGLVVLLLAERARSECARSTRAIEDQPGCPPRGR
jgi:hypothetical protein